MSAGEPVDSRSDRAAQGSVGILLLAGFVFQLPWMVPVVALLLVGGSLVGPPGDAFQQMFGILLVPRLKPGEATAAAESVRDQDIALVALCALATLAFFVISSVGWLLAIVAAVVAIVAAATGIHLGEWAIHRLFSR